MCAPRITARAGQNCWPAWQCGRPVYQRKDELQPLWPATAAFEYFPELLQWPGTAALSRTDGRADAAHARAPGEAVHAEIHACSGRKEAATG